MYVGEYTVPAIDEEPTEIMLYGHFSSVEAANEWAVKHPDIVQNLNNWQTYYVNQV